MSVLVLTVLPAAAQDAVKKDEVTPAAKAHDTSAVPDGGMPHWIRPETPEQRKERLSTQEDPGINPNEETIWWRFGKQYRIRKFDKKWSRYTDQPGFVKPFAFANFTEELYQENEKWVWVWMEELEDVPPPTEEDVREANYRELDQTQVEFLESLRGEFTPLEAPKSNVKVRFEKASTGLPEEGSWRNSLAVADMNGDGHADIILPPERAGRIIPSIFLGDGKGTWKFWSTVQWPGRLNYGSVVAADFNKDKKMDLAFGVHLSGVAILMGDGKGNFTEAERLTNFPTRRVLVRDVDADGWMDVVALSEGPVMRGSDLKGPGFGNLRAYLNRKKGTEWEGANIADPKQRISGDWLAAGDFNGDKFPDFVGSNLYFNGTDTIYLSKGANAYESLAGQQSIVPFRSYYWATTAGRFSSRNRDEAIVTFTRQWVPRLDPKLIPAPPLEKVSGLDRISFEGGTPKRTPIVRWGGKSASRVTGIGSGDFDGDGHQDILYARADERAFKLLVGDGKGGFREAVLEGLELAGTQRFYDLGLADVNGDKRLDVVMMYEAQTGTSFSRKNGKVEVFLNRGAGKAE
ncbi:MAG TPA: VCBS repeat-containing protein [Thermoanaerobaculia bacterium]|nr:VCBS repeat-containing protein [Thermoanaerobaculia bacterium]